MEQPVTVPSNGWRIYRRLLGYVLPNWRRFAVSVAAMACFATTDTGFAALMKPMLDGSFVNKDPQVIRMIPLAILGLFVVRGMAGFVSDYGMASVARDVIKKLRQQMFDHLLRVPTAFYDKSTSGQLIAKLIFDVEQVSQASANAITVVVRDTFTAMGLLGWMFYLNWKLALVFLCIGPVIAFLVVRVNKRFRLISKQIQTSVGDVTHAVEEAIEGQRVIKIFGGQDYETRHFEKINEHNQRQNLKMTAASASSVPVIQLIAAGALAGIVYLATLPSMLQSITVGTFMSFIVAMMMLLAPMKRLTTINVSVSRGIVAAESIFTLIDQEAERDSGTRSVARVRGALEFQDVAFAYETSKGQVLEDINLSIEPGQTVALVGRSGSGKSTLVSLLPRFYDPLSGCITLDGHDLCDYTLTSLRDQIALVSQDVVLFNDTIRNNIAYGRLATVSDADIERAARAAHAWEFIERLPQGLDTRVGEKGVLLSGGQRQRLAIARALLKDAPLLILDEATAALDSEAERHIQAALAQLVRNRTTLVIAHRLSTIESADLIVVLHQGRIVERGKHAALLAQGGHYAGLHRMQFGAHEAQARVVSA